MRSEQIKNQLEIVQGDITKLDCDLSLIHISEPTRPY